MDYALRIWGWRSRKGVWTVNLLNEKLLFKTNKKRNKEIENKDTKIFDTVKCLQNYFNSMIENHKQKYYYRI